MAINPRQKELWLFELNLNGFIILRDFLPRVFVEELHDQVRPLLNGEVNRMMEGDSTRLRGSHRLSFDLRQYAQYLKGPLDDDRYRRNPVVEEIVDSALGRWRYGVAKVECPLKNSDTMAWHPDVPNDTSRDPSRPPRPVRLTFNIPLVDINDSNGPMEVIPGSHRMHHHGAQNCIYDLPRLHTVKLLLRRGDAVVRDGNILHRGTPNLTDEPRILLDQTYRAIEE